MAPCRRFHVGRLLRIDPDDFRHYLASEKELVA